MFEQSLLTTCAPSQPPAATATLAGEASPPDAPSTALLRITTDRRRLDAWTLALTSRGISSLVCWVDGGLELHVSHGDLALVHAELQATDEEESERQHASRADAALVQTPATRHPMLGALLVAVMLLAFFFVTGPRSASSAWFLSGTSDAERVLEGEWWRAVTALTLHADSAHVLSNVGIGTLVIGAVMRSEGIGWGAALVLASGTAGNLVNAWVHQTLHRSVGFSTAVFGAIGILGGLAYVHGRRHIRASRPAWTALAGSVALLALLGASEKSNVDVLAHLFGCLAGVGLGLLVAWTRLRPTTTMGQWFAGLGTAAAIVSAWSVALP